MNGIRLRSVLLSGLVAGVIINISGIVLAHFVLGREYMDRFILQLPAAPSSMMFVRHLSLRFGFGLILVAGEALPDALGMLSRLYDAREKAEALVGAEVHAPFLLP